MLAYACVWPRPRPASRPLPLQVFVEYVMLHGVNDGEEQAHELGALMRDRDVTVNLIPWNPVYSPDIEFAAPGDERVNRFHSIMRKVYEVPCTIRKEKGQDISGACGQLVVEQRGVSNSAAAAAAGGSVAGAAGKSIRDIEELLPRLAVSKA